MSGKRSRHLRALALPPEHGSWGLVLEPIVLGLLVAPSLPGACIGIGAFAAFLARRPLKVGLADRASGRADRAGAAVGFLLLYGAVASTGTAAALALTGPTPLLPLAATSPLLLLFVAHDLGNRGRSWQAELAGTVAFAAVAAGIALAAGHDPWHAGALTAVLVARAVPSVLYVRSRLRLDRGRPYHLALPLGAHVAALATVLAMSRAAILPWLAAPAFILLLARATLGLSPLRPRASIRTLGFTELALGVITIACVTIGHWTGI